MLNGGHIAGLHFIWQVEGGMSQENEIGVLFHEQKAIQEAHLVQTFIGARR